MDVGRLVRYSILPAMLALLAGSFFFLLGTVAEFVFGSGVPATSLISSMLSFFGIAASAFVFVWAGHRAARNNFGLLNIAFMGAISGVFSTFLYNIIILLLIVSLLGNGENPLLASIFTLGFIAGLFGGMVFWAVGGAACALGGAFIAGRKKENEKR